MNRIRLLLVASLAITSGGAAAFEADVHYGLTEWLALQAGFDKQVAKTIAIGDQRVDSGDMQFLDVGLMYACVAKDDVGAKRAGEHHYPSAGALPGAPEQRAVSPGSDAARKAATAVIKVPPGQASYMLFKLGEALHIVQDSWSHQGISDVPQRPDMLFSCDATRAWAHPKTRGGWNSHKADLTMYWPADTLAMAQASYEVLTQYPLLSGAKRKPRSWDEIPPQLDRFISASTKTDKKNWFVSQGIDDVSFLEGISLKDGSKSFELKWAERKLPPLASPESRQHGVEPDLLDFYNRFFLRWVATDNFEALASEFGAIGSNKLARPAGTSPATSKTELIARLKVWRVRDHGRVAELAHSLRPLTADQRAAIDAAAKAKNAFARYDTPGDAFFPLLLRGNEVSPLLPFFVSTAIPPNGDNRRAIAVTKFRHVPYDTVAVVAEKAQGRWHVISVVSSVDH
jgi:hypothetical protein